MTIVFNVLGTDSLATLFQANIGKAYLQYTEKES
jgi:hypothetical protein